MSTIPTLEFPTEELRVMRDVLQNETAWDRDADTGGFNSYHSADNPDRVLMPVHEETEWKLLNAAMLRIDLELERRTQAAEAAAQLEPGELDAIAERHQLHVLLTKMGIPEDRWGATISNLLSQENLQ
jgi:hypothetical protein